MHSYHRLPCSESLGIVAPYGGGAQLHTQQACLFLFIQERKLSVAQSQLLPSFDSSPHLSTPHSRMELAGEVGGGMGSDCCGDRVPS